MGNLVGANLVGRTVGRAAPAILAAIHLVGCATEPRGSVQERREVPVLLKDDDPLLVPRRELSRYRCASGAIMRCDGPSDVSARCICSSLPTDL